MKMIDKIITIMDNSSKEKVEEYLFPPDEEIKLKTILFPHPNDDIEYIVPLFNAQKHYNHLKKMIWKHRR